MNVVCFPGRGCAVISAGVSDRDRIALDGCTTEPDRATTNIWQWPMSLVGDYHRSSSTSN